MTKTESEKLMGALTELMEASRKSGSDETLSQDDMSPQEYVALSTAVATVNGMLADNAKEIQESARNLDKLYRVAGIRPH